MLDDVCTFAGSVSDEQAWTLVEVLGKAVFVDDDRGGFSDLSCVIASPRRGRGNLKSLKPPLSSLMKTALQSTSSRVHACSSETEPENAPMSSNTLTHISASAILRHLQCLPQP